MAPDSMTQATDTARAILRTLIDAHTAGRPPLAIILHASTQESLKVARLRYWSAGPGTWSLFKVPMAVGRALGWRLQFAPEAIVA